MTDTEKQIGVIYPSDGVLDHELFCCVPPGVSAHFTRSLSSAQTDSSLPESTRHTHMAKTSDLDETARTFSFIDAGTIAYTCTIASFTRGVGFDLDIAGLSRLGRTALLRPRRRQRWRRPIRTMSVKDYGRSYPTEGLT